MRLFTCEKYDFLIEKNLPSFPASSPHHPKSGWGRAVSQRICRNSNRFIFESKYLWVRLWTRSLASLLDFAPRRLTWPRNILFLGSVSSLLRSLETLYQSSRSSLDFVFYDFIEKKKTLRAEGLEPSLEAWKATVLAITPCPRFTQKSFFCG